MPPTILVSAPSLAPAGLQRLQQAGARVLFLDDDNPGAAMKRLLVKEAVDAVISRTVDLSGEAIAGCHTLKVICKHGVGVSNIDVAAASARRIPVFVTPGANAQSVAEMTLGLMLAASRRIAWMDRELRAGRWSRAQDGIELSGRTLGLVGFGQIGQRVAKAAQAIGMSVIAFDPALTNSPISGVDLARSLDDLLRHSNVLSLHVPLTARTRGMIGAAQLALLPQQAIVINTARGEVIDEAALIEALRSERLFAAGLDTTNVEPLPVDSPLAALPNVVLTPHVGGSTPAALSAMAFGAADTVLRFLAGERVDAAACVNPETLTAAFQASQ